MNTPRQLRPFTGSNIISSKHLIPICYPWEYLIKEITVNGYNGSKPFIPMQELFNILDPSDYVEYDGDFDDKSMQIDDGWNHVLFFKSDNDQLEFSFDSNTLSFTLYVHSEEWCPVSCQYEMFQLLIDWHFPVGLSEFEKVTEKFNPYKPKQ